MWSRPLSRLVARTNHQPQHTSHAVTNANTLHPQHSPHGVHELRPAEASCMRTILSKTPTPSRRLVCTRNFAIGVMTYRGRGWRAVTAFSITAATCPGPAEVRREEYVCFD